MKPRSAWILGVCLTLGCLLLGLSFGQPSAAQDEKPFTKGAAANRGKGAAMPASIGRYQVGVAGPQRGEIIVIDTTTGHCWRRTVYGAEQWIDLGSPPTREGR